MRKTTTLFFAIFIALISAASALNAKDISVGEFITAYKQEESNLTAKNFIKGVGQGIFMANVVLSTKKNLFFAHLEH